MSYGGGDLKAAPIAFPSSGRSARRPSKTRSSASRPRAPKRKPACKYGPRDADGYCPKKPRSTPTAVETAIARAAGVKASRGRSVSTRVQRTAERIGGTLAQRAVAKRVATVAKRRAAKAAETAAGVAAPAVAGGLLRGKILSGGAKTIGARLGIAAAAGLAAYFLTSWVQKKIRAAKDQKAAAKAALADSYRQTRLQVAREAGRDLTATEHAELATAFRREAAKLGWRW